MYYATYEVIIGGKYYPVRLVEKKLKRIHMQIKDNEIVVTGYHINQDKANELIFSNQEWVLKHLAISNLCNEKFRFDEFKSFKIFYILGKAYDIEIKKNEYIINNYHFSYKNEIDIAYEQKRIRKYFTFLLDERVDYYKKVFNRDCTITYKDMKSKYGYNHLRKNLICLSTRLIHYPTELIDYIIVHEFCHFVVAPHNKTFYNEVSKYYPDYKKAVKGLKYYRPLME